MKTFILCGGFGTRLDDLGTVISKSMVRIGSKPILMEIIQNYTDQGFDEFVFCLGHKANTVIDYFLKENKKKTKIISQNKNLINFHYKDSQT
jgi:glucose-1-phosphate cytidylyltransferase